MTEQVKFNVPPDTLQVILGTNFTGCIEPNQQCQSTDKH